MVANKGCEVRDEVKMVQDTVLQALDQNQVMIHNMANQLCQNQPYDTFSV